MGISRKPSPEERHKYPATREAAIALELEFYHTGVSCRGQYEQHNDYRYTSTGRCVDCKRLENERQRGRRRSKTPQGKAYQKAWREEVKSLGLGYSSMPGGGAGYRGLIPQGAIGKPDDAETNRAARAKCKGKNERDHICPQPQNRKFDKLIIGLECAENLQVLNPSMNRKKGGAVPHRDDFTKPADRPLTLEELRWFVRHRMAIWTHDVTLGKDGERATINWHLYRFGDDGLVEYLGNEPALAEAAE